MDIRIPIYIIIFISYFILRNANISLDLKKKIYIVIFTILMVLESSLRNISVGPDTSGYYDTFLSLQYESWSDVLSRFRLAYIDGVGKDPGFFLFVKIIQIFTKSFNFFLFLIALIFYIPLAKILYKNLSNLLYLTISFVFFISLFQIITLSGIRQQIATGFTFIAFLKLQSNHNIKFFIYLFIGFFFHISSAIFLLLFILYRFFGKHLKIIHLISLLSIPLVIFLLNNIIIIIASFMVNDYYSGYAESEVSNSSMYLIIMELISVISFLFLRKDLIKEKDFQLIYSNLPLVTIFVPFILLDGSMIRLGQYFTLYLLLILPAIIEHLKITSNNKKILSIFTIIALLIFSLKSDFVYSFYWN